MSVGSRGGVQCQAWPPTADASCGTAAEQGYCMPLDLGAKGSCHIGGNVATNAGVCVCVLGSWVGGWGGVGGLRGGFLAKVGVGEWQPRVPACAAQPGRQAKPRLGMRAQPARRPGRGQRQRGPRGGTAGDRSWVAGTWPAEAPPTPTAPAPAALHHFPHPACTCCRRPAPAALRLAARQRAGLGGRACRQASPGRQGAACWQVAGRWPAVCSPACPLGHLSVLERRASLLVAACRWPSTGPAELAAEGQHRVGLPHSTPVGMVLQTLNGGSVPADVTRPLSKTCCTSSLAGTAVQAIPGAASVSLVLAS